MSQRLLLDHAIAGVQHHATVEQLQTLRESKVLDLVREPNNRFDPNAVRIDYDGVKLGYVPATYSAIVAGLIDSGQVALLADVGDTIAPKRALCHFRLWLLTGESDSGETETA